MSKSKYKIHEQPAPKFVIDQPVWRIDHKHKPKNERACDACENGKVTLKNGKVIDCPECYGSGTVSDYGYIYSVDETPWYITGYNLDVQKSRGKLDVGVRYYCDRTLDPMHDVYLDSTGDLRIEEDQLYASREAALVAAVGYTEAEARGE